MTSSYISLRPPVDMELFKGIKNPHITLAFLPDHPAEEVKTVLPDVLTWDPISLRVHGSGVWAGRRKVGDDQFWISYFTVECNRRSEEMRDLRMHLLLELMNDSVFHSDNYDFIPHITRFISYDPVEHLNAAYVPLNPAVFTADTLYISDVGDYENAYTIPMEGPNA